MATNHIPQLAEALQRGRLALFLGADLPQEATGLPSRADLAAGLAERLGLSVPAPPWPEIAARYEASAGLNALITWLRDQLETAGQGPGPVHGLLARLPVTTYLTTAYDTRLHEALREAGRRPNLPVVDASSLGLLDAGRPTVVHLFGTYDRPDSLVLTAAHLRQLPQTKAQILAGLVHPTLANRSVLIVGQDLRDTHFQTLYQTALFQAGTIRPSAYAAWPGLEEWETQTWRAQEVRVLDLPAMELLSELAGQPQAIPLPAGPPEPEPVSPGRPEPPQSERLHIDPDNVPYAAIRDLLEAAFDAGTLRSFCQDRPAFEPLLRRFGPADGLASLVATVLEYCRTELLWDDLLAEVKGANPRQYARFQEQLGGPAAALPIPGRPPGRLEPLPQPSPTNRPTVEGTDPADGAKNVSRWLRSIKVRFKRDMRSDRRGIGSGPKGWFGLDDPDVDYEPVTRTFTISRDNAEPLPPNTTIEFTINDPRHEGGFVDLDGNPAEYHSFCITTGSELEMDLGALRRWLKQRFDDPGLDTFCLDHFSEVYDSFGRGMRKDEKITLLLDYCRRLPAHYQRLVTALGG